ncbi:hypothetical protein LJC68_07230 [Bacteroidales bacterium OttesenSCG-928-B11]|nr:hypothetical protein [Bacteroidales bacterium OttesenSCG-928-C03]MDL2312651.1 hypothetical protein [Bacteroidales bacterium OttesenSCG-928-B11]MDL2326122.1 hypothetical protein [Bacteroidales bacterium OttesenSCG-928-A14]
MEDIRYRKVVAFFYALMWAVVLMAATFPAFIQKCSFDFLIAPDIVVASKTYLFSLTMIIALHFFETAYCISIHDYSKQQLKKIGISNSFSIALLAVFLICTVAFESSLIKMVFFLLVWLIIALLKYISISFTEKVIIELNTPR